MTEDLNLNAYNITNVKKIYDISGNSGTNSQILVSNGNNVYWRDQFLNKSLTISTILADQYLSTPLLKLTQLPQAPSQPYDGYMYLNQDEYVYVYSKGNWVNITNPNYVTTTTLSGYVNDAINSYVGILFIDPSANYVTTNFLDTTLLEYVKFTDISNISTGGGSVDLSNYVTSSSLTSSLSSYALTSSLNNYATTSSLSSYALTSTLNNYATTSSLSSYVLTSTLNNYVTTSSLTTTLAGYLTPSSSSGYLTPQLFQVKVDSDSKASTVLPVFMGKVEFGILNPMTTNYGFTLENVSGTTTFTSYNNGSLPIQFKGQLKNYKNSAYENVLTTSDLSTYVTSSSLTSTLLNYITSSSLTSTLLNYITNSSLTSTLLDYVTNSSLTSTLTSYVTNLSLTSTLLDYVTNS
jgi:hypothetical protein